MRPSERLIAGSINAAALGAAVVVLWGLALGLLTIQ